MSNYSNEIKTLGAYVRERRDRLGWSLTTLAVESGLSKSELSALENGKIGLPGAEKRRKLAAALGVSHLEILLAAGEITPAEVERAGVQGVIPEDPVRAELIEKLQMVRLTDERTEMIEGILDGYIRRDRNTREYVQHPSGQGDEGRIS